MARTSYYVSQAAAALAAAADQILAALG